MPLTYADFARLIGPMGGCTDYRVLQETKDDWWANTPDKNRSRTFVQAFRDAFKGFQGGDDLVEDVGRFAMFLRDGLTRPSMVNAFQAVESDLRAVFKKQSNNDMKGQAVDFAEQQIREKAYRHHVLSDVLAVRLEAVGFKPTLTRAFPVPLRFIPGKEFEKILLLRRHFKDPLVVHDHGEWSHLLQFMLFARSNEPLNNTLGDVCEALRCDGTVLPGSLWRMVADRSHALMPQDANGPYPARGVDHRDFGNPDALHYTLLGRERLVRRNMAKIVEGYGTTNGALYEYKLADQCDLAEALAPLLCALIRHRHDKRAVMFARLKALEEHPDIFAAAKNEAPNNKEAQKSFAGAILYLLQKWCGDPDLKEPNAAFKRLPAKERQDLLALARSDYLPD